MNKLTQFKEKLIIRLFIILYLISLVLQVNYFNNIHQEQ